MPRTYRSTDRICMHFEETSFDLSLTARSQSSVIYSQLGSPWVPASPQLLKWQALLFVSLLLRARGRKKKKPNKPTKILESHILQLWSKYAHKKKIFPTFLTSLKCWNARFHTLANMLKAAGFFCVVSPPSCNGFLGCQREAVLWRAIIPPSCSKTQLTW